MKGKWTKYGLTKTQYNKLRRMKPGCWICGKVKKRDGRPVRLFIDHDHVSQRVRGMLDYSCNRRLIGRRRDGELYRKAAEYLDSEFDGRHL